MAADKAKLYKTPSKAAETAQFVIASRALNEFRSLDEGEESTKRDHNREVILAARGGRALQQEPTQTGEGL
jgi:hypothetical protein